MQEWVKGLSLKAVVVKTSRIAIANSRIPPGQESIMKFYSLSKTNLHITK